jgi:hypothetical protein
VELDSVAWLAPSLPWGWDAGLAIALTVFGWIHLAISGSRRAVDPQTPSEVQVIQG